MKPGSLNPSWREVRTPVALCVILLFPSFAIALLLLVLWACGVDVSRWSHTDAHEPAIGDFDEFLRRDLAAHFRRSHGQDLSVEFELLRNGATQFGLGYPHYYVWVTVTIENRVVTSGAAKVTAENKKGFYIGTFVPRRDILASPTALDRVIPESLRAKTRTRAGFNP